MPIANSYSTSNVTPTVTSTGPASVNQIQTNSTTSVSSVVTSTGPASVNQIQTNSTLSVTPEIRRTVTSIPTLTASSPTPPITPGTATSTNPLPPGPVFPDPANLVVPNDEIPEPVPQVVFTVPTPANTVVGPDGFLNPLVTNEATPVDEGNIISVTNVYNTFLSNIEIYDGNTLISNSIQQMIFVGDGVSITGSNTAYINIPGGNSSGNGVPGGSNTQVQYNNSGNFGGNSGFTFNSTIGQLSVPGNVVVGNATGGNLTGANVIFSNSFTSNGGVVDFATNNPEVLLGDVSNITIGGGTSNYVLITDGAGNLSWASRTSRSGVTVQEEGTNVLANATTINFVGSGVTASNVSNVATITINSGISGIAVQEEGTNVLANATTINFVGSGVTASNVGNVATITIAGGAVAGANTQLQFNDGGNFGASSNLTFDKTTSNLTVGSNVLAVNFIGSGANTPTVTSGTNLDLIATAGVRVPSNISLYGGNVSLGAVANLHITGGTANYVLTTDGAGNLSWSAGGGSGANGTPAGSNTQVQYNNNGNFGASSGFTFDSTTGWLRAPGNITANSELHFGYDQGFSNVDDAWGRLRMFPGNVQNANINTGYGFTYQNTGSGPAYLALTNEERNFNQALIIADGSRGPGAGNVPVTAFGFSIIDSLANTSPTTGNENGWTPLLNLDYNGNFTLPGIPSWTSNSGTANVGSLVVRGRSNLNSVSNITITGGTIGQVLTTNGNGNLTWSNAGAGLSVRDEGANVLTSASIMNFVGAGVVASNVGGVATITIPGAGGNGSPGGANGQVQYNDNDIFGGNPGFTFDESNTTVTANNFVATSTANLGDVGNVTILGGTANYVLTTDGTGTLSWSNLSATSNLAAGGANTQVQYNDDGILGGNPGFTFNEGLSLITANNLTVSSKSNLNSVSNVTILGGTNGYYLQTDGSGNLTWAPGSNSTGNGSVAGANTQVQFNDEGNFGAVAGFTFNKTSTTLTANNIVASSTANLGDVGNVYIGGGTANYVLTTDGTGTLTWSNLSATSNIAAGGSNTQVQYNDDGILGGNPAFTFDEGNTVITANNLTVSSITRLGNVGNVHIDGGTANFVLTTDGSGNLSWTSGNSIANVAAGGANTQVQYNDNGILGGNPAFTFDEGNTVITANNLTVSSITRLGNVGNVHIDGGINGYFLQTDGTGNLVWGVPIGLPGNGQVAGANTQIQFNDAGNFGAVAGFTFDKTTTTFTANNIIGNSTVNFTTASNVSLGNVGNVHIDGGNANFILTTDGAGNLSWANLAGGGAGNIAAGGANTQVQYNDNGVLGGNPAFTFDEGLSLITANNFVATSTANLGAVSNVTITGGTNGYVLQTDGAGNLTWTAQTGGNAGNGIPAGANTQVQFNDAGNFGASAGFTFNSSNTLLTTNNLAVTTTANFISASNVSLGNVGNIHISGGGANYVLVTDGSGDLSWANLSSTTIGIKAGGANTQVQYNDDGIIGGHPAFTFDEGLQLVTANNFAATSTANLGDVANVYIGGGTSNYVLITDGTGTLSWGNLAAGDAGNIKAGGSNTQIQYNDDGVLGGNPALTFDEGLTLVTANNFAATSTANLGDIGNVYIGGGNALDVITTIDGTGNLAWATITFEPGGSNTQVQYNDDGAFGGDSTFTFDETTTLLTVNNFAATSTANLGSNANVTITGGGPGQVLTTDGAGNLSWSDGTANTPGGYYLHTQSVASNVWTVNHNLNRTYVVVEPVDANNNSYNGRYDFPTINFVNANTLTMTWTTAVDGYAAVVGGGISYYNEITGITVQDEGSNVLANATTLNFVGPSVTASDVGGVATINIAGIPGVIIQDEGNVVVGSTNTFNFVGAGVEASNVGGIATVTINGGITVYDEGVPFVTSIGALNFVGLGVTATVAPGSSLATITIPGSDAGDTIYNLGNVSGTTPININNGTIQTCTMTANTFFNISSVASGQSITLIITQGVGAPYLATYGSTVLWASGYKALSTVAGAVDMVNMVNIGGTYYATLTTGYAA